jgi:hypothetical protein
VSSSVPTSSSNVKLKLKLLAEVNAMVHVDDTPQHMAYMRSQQSDLESDLRRVGAPKKGAPAI